MSNQKYFTALASAIVAAGMLSASPVISDSSAPASIEAASDDRGTYQFYVDSNQRLLSARLRVVGPNDYVHEERSEVGYLEWTADSSLADGFYTWEVSAVTAPRSAPQRDISTSSEWGSDQPVSANSSDDNSGSQSVSRPPTALEQVEKRYKSVTSHSGRFRVTDGQVIPLETRETATVDPAEYEPGVFALMAGAALDWLFPAAHAQNYTDDVSITTTNPGVIFDDTSGATGDDWRMRGRGGEFYVYDPENLLYPFRIEKNSPESSLYVRSTSQPQVGIGTATPTESLHISSTNPRIRLDDTASGTSWRIQNTNESRFQVLSLNDSQPFSIEAPSTTSQAEAQHAALYIDANGNVGLGTSEPAQKLHVIGNHIRIEDSNSTWDLNPGSQGLWINQSDPTTFGVLKLQNDAPADSLVADATGVGIGTNSPETKLTVREDAGADASLLTLSNTGGSRILFKNRSAPDSGSDSRSWVFSTHSGGFRVNRDFSGQVEMDLDNNGNLTIAGTLTQGSSRQIKDNITPLNGTRILERLNELTLAEWSYKDSDSRHAGPMAEDFHAAFGLGPDERHIAPGDMAGLSLAAVQALYEENKQLRDRLKAVEEHLASSE